MRKTRLSISKKSFYNKPLLFNEKSPQEIEEFFVFAFDEKFIQNLFREVLVDQQKKTPQEIEEFFIFYLGISMPLKNSSKVTFIAFRIFISVFN